MNMKAGERIIPGANDPGEQHRLSVLSALDKRLRDERRAGELAHYMVELCLTGTGAGLVDEEALGAPTPASTAFPEEMGDF